MARKARIDNDTLIQFIDEYVFNECGGTTTKVKFSDVAQYIREHGYPDYKDYTLSRNEVAREYIESLNEKLKESVASIVSYRTLDVRQFLQNNPTEKSLTMALTQLSDYYKKVSETAVNVLKRSRDYEKQISEAENTVNNQNKTIEALEGTVAGLKKEKRELQEKVSKLTNVVNKYIYPELANKVLTEEGFAQLPSEHIVDDPEIIRPDNVIPISKELLSIIKEDEK